MSDTRKGYVLVTGANGFIGQALCRTIRQAGFNVRACVRSKENGRFTDCETIEVGEIGPHTQWQNALMGVETVIHLAAITQVRKKKFDSLEIFRKVNVAGTGRLAHMAAQAGVKRFIFISSVKVNGEGSCRPYTEEDAPEPKDAYGISKREAEDLLAYIANQTGLQTVVLRIPLVYGPGVKSNFKSLLDAVALGLPLPFKAIHNQRSFIYLGNLIDAIITCITHPLAAGQTFMVSDGQDISTPDLIKMLALAMDKKPILFSLNPAILKTLCRIVGKGEEIEKLTGTILIDNSKIKNLLGWKTPFSLEEGLKDTVKYYQKCRDVSLI
ncbi:MAG: NAD-dependent epimerase/dehydratase family protein [Candidatus Omnitrophica bacterium]|nr:NAD-dependent epimerase/dehydratase family protein [Candidatus Omnitrophota bacterium]